MTKNHTVLVASVVVGIAVCTAVLPEYIPGWIATYNERQTKAQAEADAQRVYYAKPAWERTPQAAVEDVVTFAPTFVQALGYSLRGAVNCDRWQWDGWHKQYTCYAMVDPAWPPLELICGPTKAYDVLPLGCSFGRR
jgi:hypothetical protein